MTHSTSTDPDDPQRPTRTCLYARAALALSISEYLIDWFLRGVDLAAVLLGGGLF